MFFQVLGNLREFNEVDGEGEIGYIAKIGKGGSSMECQKERNKELCNCTYEPCPRKGICCECIRYHLKMRQLPGCCFNREAEATFDRSFEHFARLVQQGVL